MNKPKPRTPITDLEERHAWDLYLANAVSDAIRFRSLAEAVDDAAYVADRALAQRRARFGLPQREHVKAEAEARRETRREQARARRRASK